MNFTTVFEIVADDHVPFSHGSQFSLLTAVAMGMFGTCCLWWAWRRHGGMKAIAFFVGLMSVIWGVFVLSFELTIVRPGNRDNAKLYALYRAGACETVEGTVEVLRTQPEEGHTAAELVRVGSNTFSLNFFSTSRAYRRTLAHGGVLQEGTFVRIWHTDGNILRVDLGTRNREYEDGRQETAP